MQQPAVLEDASVGRASRARRAAALVAACAIGGAAVPAIAADKAPPAPIEWVSVAKSDTQEAFVDPASRRDRDGFIEVVARYEYAQPQPFGKKTFRSARNVYRFDCAGRRLADRENKVYEGPELQGKVVTNSTRSTKNLIWRDAAKGTVDGTVLDYVCRKLAGTPAGGGAGAAAPGATGAAPAAATPHSAPTTAPPPAQQPSQMPKKF